MMNKKIDTKLILLSILLLFIPLACSHGLAQPLASMKDSHPLREDVSQPAQVEETHSVASSPLWRPFLWEAIPAEWLSDPSKRPIMEAYQQREWKPFFINSHFELQKSAHAFLARLENLENDAIDSKSYQAPTKGIKRLEQLRASLNKIDPEFRDSRAAFSESPSFEGQDDSEPRPEAAQYASISPETRVPDGNSRNEKEQKYKEAFRAASETDMRLANLLVRFTAEMNPFYKEKLVDALTGAIPITEFLSGLEPTSPHYETLRKAYKKYRQLAVQSPHQRLVGGATLRAGESGNDIRELQKRLQQEEFYDGKITGTFDSATQEAIRKFQRAHLIDADGAVGQKTREWLNVSYDQKAQMIAHSMKTMRQSQTRQHDTFVRINIPQFTLEYFREGKVKNVHKVIVGKSSGKKVKLHGRLMGENHTPPISSAIEQVIVNPRWYITKRILAELADNFAADPSYFSRHGYVWTSMFGEPRVFQRPGPTNPLGQIKFEFPNAYAVFLHDTPKKQLFQRSRRDFSHGCIRVEGARKLAQSIVADDQNPAAGKIESYLEKNAPTHIKLNQPVPIVVEYVTATADENGRIVFSDDIYGWFKTGSESKS